MDGYGPNADELAEMTGEVTLAGQLELKVKRGKRGGGRNRRREEKEWGGTGKRNERLEELV